MVAARAATVLLASGRLRGRFARFLVPFVVAVASTLWAGSAMLSVLNTTS